MTINREGKGNTYTTSRFTLTMKYPAFLTIVLLLFTSTAIVQGAMPDETAFPSLESMFGSMTSGSDGKETSLSDSIDKMMQSLSEGGAVQNTEESVKTAIEGPLVVEEAVPDTNKEVVEAIDKRTNRYSPRLKIDPVSFPLARPSIGRGVLPAERIAKHLQLRLRLEQPINIEFQDRTVCLRGTVSTERQKDLALLILRFEPGIDAVKNELVVGE